VILDGSFVMGCVDEPDDIDLILVLPTDWDMDAELKPYQYNLVSKKSIKQLYRFDLITVRASSAQEAEWIAFFKQVNVKWHEQFDWPADTWKGIIRVML
jgi:hypothetical protein